MECQASTLVGDACRSLHVLSSLGSYNFAFHWRPLSTEQRQVISLAMHDVHYLYESTSISHEGTVPYVVSLGQQDKLTT